MILTHSAKKLNGIFGTLYTDDGIFVGFTLEHAYPQGDGFEGKIPNGSYTCVRGMHRLHNMTEDFETFEITGIEGHTDILFHWGNYNKDSEGCVLLGNHGSSDAVLDSRACFASFMKLTEGQSEFTLQVREVI